MSAGCGGGGFEEADVQALAAGGLPPRVARRIAGQRQRHTWTSDFSVDELAAVGSVGFFPVSQVMGSSVYQVGWSGMGQCGFYFNAYEMKPYVEALQHARGLALRRLALEAAAAGADGVVGVRFNVRWLGEGMGGQRGEYEFTTIGTAVRGPAGSEPAGAPFLSALSGHQFAKLLLAGYVPCDLVMGIAAIYVHSNWMLQRQQSSWSNQELPDYSRAVIEARHLAMARLREGVVRAGADGSVGSDITVQVRTVPCGLQREVHDHVIEFFAIGTAVSRFAEGRQPVRMAKRLDDPAIGSIAVGVPG